MDSQRASSLRGLLLFLTGLSLGLFIWGIVGIIVGLAWLPNQQSAANVQFAAVPTPTVVLRGSGQHNPPLYPVPPTHESVSQVDTQSMSVLDNIHESYIIQQVTTIRIDTKYTKTSEIRAFYIATLMEAGWRLEELTSEEAVFTFSGSDSYTYYAYFMRLSSPDLIEFRAGYIPGR